jgi:hypothetical protein
VTAGVGVRFLRNRRESGLPDGARRVPLGLSETCAMFKNKPSNGGQEARCQVFLSGLAGRRGDRWGLMKT